MWKHLAEKADSLYPIGGGVADDAPPPERLAGLVRALLRRMTDRSLAENHHRLHLMEMVNPTGLIDKVLPKVRGPLRRRTQALLGELLGPAATSRNIEMCELSLISQCRMARPKPHGRRGPLRVLDELDLDVVADHITRFTLGGIERTRREMEVKEGARP